MPILHRLFRLIKRNSLDWRLGCRRRYYWFGWGSELRCVCILWMVVYYYYPYLTHVFPPLPVRSSWFCGDPLHIHHMDCPWWHNIHGLVQALDRFGLYGHPLRQNRGTSNSSNCGKFCSYWSMVRSPVCCKNLDVVDCLVEHGTWLAVVLVLDNYLG